MKLKFISAAHRAIHHEFDGKLQNIPFEIGLDRMDISRSESGSG
jgi:hypothetical protein